MGRIIIGGRSRRGGKQNAIRNQFGHAFTPVHGNFQLGRLWTRAQQRDLVNRKGGKFMPLNIDCGHGQGINFGLFRRT